MRGYGPYHPDVAGPPRPRCGEGVRTDDDADRLGRLSAALRVAQEEQAYRAAALTRATQRVIDLQREVDNLREAILG